VARAVEISRPLIDARKHQLTVTLPPLSLPKMSSWHRSAWVNRSFLPARRMRGSCRPLPRRQHRYPRKIPQHYAPRREKRGQGILLRPAAGRDTDSEVTGSDCSVCRWAKAHGTLTRRLVCVPPASAVTQPTRAREPGPTPATGHSAAVGAQATTAIVRPPVLGLAGPVLGRMEGRPGDRFSGHRRYGIVKASASTGVGSRKAVRAGRASIPNFAGSSAA
jgi:hypothetical protein